MSELRVDSVKSKGGGAPNLPKGVTISGITTAATLGATQIDVSNVNVSGVVTSGTLSGDLLSTGTPTLGLGVTINSSGLVISGVATAGIVSATTLYGDGSNLTGIGASIAPLFYNPDVSDSDLTLDTGIGITFNQQVKAGSGEVTLRLVGAAGTVVENFGVGSSVTISENRVTINPTADLSLDTVYHISYPSGCFTNNEGTDYVGTAYTFQARPYYYNLFGWGLGSYGILGYSPSSSYVTQAKSSPTQIPGNKWRSIAGEVTTKLASRTDGTLWGWGRNSYGNLGQNQAHNVGDGGELGYASPVQIGTEGTWTVLHSSSYGTSMATKTDGTLWVWGANSNGQLGLNDRTHRSSPVQVPGTTWPTSGSHKLSTLGNGSMAAIKQDGTLWVWGYNDNGRMGINQPAVNYSSPVQVPGTTWNTVHASTSLHTFATKTDGTAWAWGWNSTYGALGINDRTKRSSPTQIPGTSWELVKSSQYGGFGKKTDGTLWTWGLNDYGQLGQNNKTNYSSPVQVPGTTWRTIVGARNKIGGTKTDGTLWTWGMNFYGGLGQNNTLPHQKSSPVQVGAATNWSSKAYAISGGDGHNMHAITIT